MLVLSLHFILPAPASCAQCCDGGRFAGHSRPTATLVRHLSRSRRPCQATLLQCRAHKTSSRISRCYMQVGPTRRSRYDEPYIGGTPTCTSNRSPKGCILHLACRCALSMPSGLFHDENVWFGCAVHASTATFSACVFAAALPSQLLTLKRAYDREAVPGR